MTNQSEDIATAVYDAIEDYIFETHKFCSIKEIQEQVGQSRSVCEKVLQDLLSQNKTYVVYQRQGVPTIYVPKYMMNEILLTQSKPQWLEDYRFGERNKIDEKIQELKNELLQFEMFERLLYATGEPLEEAVYFALKWLGIKKVKYNKTGDRDIQDIDFEINNTKFLVEVKGKIKSADKDDVEELNGWRKQEVLKEENEGKTIDGILMINHYRKTDPKERKEILTIPAKKWLKMYQLKVFTTLQLFGLIKDIGQHKLSKEEAITRIIQGQQV